jgi:penicillin amidase
MISTLLHRAILPVAFTILVCFMAVIWTGDKALARAQKTLETIAVVEPELWAPVSVLKDSEGIPHIFADSEHDGWFVLGYLHARDRFFQMDYARHLFSGTLMELVGESVLESDAQFRFFGLRRGAEESWDVYSPEARGLIEAYCAGVNAMLESESFQLPPEYADLELSEVEPWSVIDTLTVSKGIAFGLSFDTEDLDRTDALLAYQEAGDDQGFDGTKLFYRDLFRSAPFDPAISIQQGSGQSNLRTGHSPDGTVVPDAERTRTLDPRTRNLIRTYLKRIDRIPFLRELRSRESRAGSNFWVIGGQLTESGFPLLANDPHLGLSMPAVFYESHLLVSDDPVWGEINVSGVGFPGVPSFALGCTSRVCWGAPVNPLDVKARFELSVNIFAMELEGTVFDGEVEEVVVIPQTYRANKPDSGVLDDLESVEVGALEGGNAFLVPRRNMGPIVAVDISSLFNPKGISVQFSGWRATREIETFLRLARVQSVGDFRDALQFFDFGSQNWAYADIDGNIAYFTSGELPLREDLQSGALDGLEPWFIRDGTHQDKNEWIPAEDKQPGQALAYEVLPFDEMPQVVNPSQGYIANGNSDPIGVTLDNHVLGNERAGGGILYLNPGYASIRMGRISDMIEEIRSQRKFTLDDMRTMQADNYLLDAAVFLPFIVTAFDDPLDAGTGELQELRDDSRIAAAVERLRLWSRRTPTGIQAGYDPGDDPENLPSPGSEEVKDSVAATIYAVWRSRILANTIDSTLQRLGLSGHRPDSERSLSALRHLLEQFNSTQGVGASGVNFFVVEGASGPEEARDTVILRSLDEALDLLASDDFAAAFGKSTNQEDYRWGMLHRVTFDHFLGDNFNVPPNGGFPDLASNLAGIARSGGYEVVDASAHSARADGPNEFKFGSGAARRFIAELNPDGIEAYQIIPGGPSGNRDSAGYTSQLGRWLTNQYHPLLLDRGDVEDDETVELTLAPASTQLYFPYYQGDQSGFTAFAVANIGEGEVEAAFSAWSREGNLLPFSDNPANWSLSPGSQRARLGHEVFGTAISSTQQGWVELAVPLDNSVEYSSSLASFTQLGDFQLRKLDGGVAVAFRSKRLFFTRVYEGETAFRGQSAETFLSLANPDDESVTVSLLLAFGSAGGPQQEQAEFEIDPKGVLFGTVSELLGVSDVDGGYIRVDVLSGQGVVGFEAIRVGSSHTVIGLNAALGSWPANSYSAQLASGEGVFFTAIKLINTSEFDREITLEAFPEGADNALQAGPFDLASGQSIELDAADLFQSPGSTELLVGSLVLRANGLGVIGDVIFGDPGDLELAAALPLQSRLFTEAVFGHVANSQGFFTGLAFFNPGPDPVDVDVELYASDGTLVGELSEPLLLSPGGRTSKTLVQLIPESAGQAGGYIVVRSTGPLVGQELFGTSDSSLLSAVPPTIQE